MLSSLIAQNETLIYLNKNKNMNFILKLRTPKENEITSHKAFMAHEKGDFESYVCALAEDIEQEELVSKIECNENLISIETSIIQKDLENKIQSLIHETTLAYNLIIVSLKEI